MKKFFSVKSFSQGDAVSRVDTPLKAAEYQGLHGFFICFVSPAYDNARFLSRKSKKPRQTEHELGLGPPGAVLLVVV